MNSWERIQGCLIGLILMLSSATLAWADAPVIAGAADLKFALEEIAAAFKEDTKREVSLVFGSSGNFYRQIGQGAPFRMFLSADEGFVFKLADAGKTVDRGVLYAVGRIVILVPHGSPLKADGKLNDLTAALADGRLRKFAIANPEHAPYGKRAEEALRHAGLWEKIKDRLVLGENVSQAAQFALSGGAEGGIIALSLALAPTIAAQGTHALIPESMHSPLRQRMVLLRDASPAAARFYAYLSGAPARATLRRYGFLPPGAAM